MTFINTQLSIRIHFVILLGVILHLFCGSFSVYAQSEIVKEINQMTGQVESKITANEYYLNEHKINSKRFSLHQPGYFQYFERYYYTTDKRSEKKSSILLKAIVTVKEKEEHVYLKKFIYDDDKDLIYYIERKSKVSKAPENEIRIYFKKDKLIRYMINDQDEIGVNMVPQDKISNIISESKRYRQKFDEQIKEIQFY